MSDEPAAAPVDVVDPGRRAARHALLAFLFAGVMVSVLVRIPYKLPAIGHVGSALIAVLFLYVPVYVTWRRKEDLDAYGFHMKPVGSGLKLAAIACAIMFPLFIGGFFAFFETVCDDRTLRPLMEAQCNGYLAHGLDRLHAPHLSWMSNEANSTLSLEWCVVQLVVVALPEELFFRGMMLGLLEKRFPPKRTILGAKVGLALVLSSLAFGLVHFPKAGDPRDLFTFFPSLVFGWMRARTGSIFASTVTHGASNILARTLELMTQR